jgi:hypothetical protein
MAFVGVLCMACSMRVVPSELTGTYEVYYPFGRGSLRIKSSGQYEQVLHIGSRTATARGEWKYVEDGGQGILAQSCLSATNAFGEISAGWETPSSHACGWSVGLRFLFGGPVEISDDKQYHYRKVSSDE